ncbi:hypothetical protein [Campylobacter sp.]|nr:hypothetical protein [Campylobacter sp.]
MTIIADTKKIHKVIVEAKIPTILFFIFTHSVLSWQIKFTI